MKSILYRLAGFFLLIFGFNIICYVLIFNIYLSEYVHSPENMKRFHSFLFADSHGLALDTLLEGNGTFNFSNASDNYGDMLRKLRFLHDKGIPVHKVIFTVDDYTLSEYRDRVNNYDRSVYYSSYESSHAKTPGNYMADKYLRYYIPIMNPKDRDLIKLFVSSKLKACIERNPKKNEQKPDWDKVKDKAKLVKMRAEWQFPNDKISLNQKERLEEIVAFCQANQIEMIGIKFPVTVDYQKAVAKKNYGSDLVFKKAGIGIKDFSTLQWPDSLFENQDHLNKKGGKLFSELLLKEVNLSN